METKAIVVDSHSHIGDLKGIWGHMKHSAQEQIELMEECGVDKAVVFSFSSGLLAHEDFISANDMTAQAVKQYPSRLIGFAVVNPMFEQRALEEMRRANGTLSLQGLKLHPVLHGAYPIDSEFVSPVVEQAIRYGWPIVFHTDLNNQAASPYRLVSLAKRYPESKLVMAHMGIDPTFMDVSIKEAAPFPNIFVDTSAITDTPDIIRFAVETLGAKRVLFGTDGPGLSAKLALLKVRLANLGASQERRVLGKNILEMLSC